MPNLKDVVGAVATRPATTFMQAVVIDVIHDPAAFRASYGHGKFYDDDDIAYNDFIERAPRNSVIAKVLNEGMGKKDKLHICLPFFPPHLCFPVKPGEHVWLISPSPDGTETAQYYWMCRVPTYEDVDDINYTSDSRWLSFGKPKEAATSGEDERKDGEKNELLFGFPNGAASSENTRNIDGGPHAYANLINSSVAIKSFKFEPVPRLTKRPGDFVIQGSNNTAIILGTNRGEPGGYAPAGADADRFSDFKGSVEKSEWLGIKGEIYARSSATQIDTTEMPLPAADNKDIHGAIDIVVGRGLRVRTAPGPTHPDADSKPGLEQAGMAPTYPRIKTMVNPSDSEIKAVDGSDDKGPDLSTLHENSPGLIETSKNPLAFDKDVKENHFDHAIEGDPDFRYDAARIYISADSSPDKDFGLDDQAGTIGGVDLSKAPAPDQPHPLAGSSVVAKADHIRIIARKDPSDMSPNPVENGSIRIIKEGDIPAEAGGESAGERAIIAIEPNGTIYIDGPRIVIGNGRLDPPDSGAGEGKGQHVFIGGEDATESSVLGEAFADAILAFAGDVCTMLGGTGVSVPAMTTTTPSELTPGIQASFGNMGGPTFNPSAQLAIDALHTNLSNALSKTTKTK